MGWTEIQTKWGEFKTGWLGQQLIPSLKLGFLCLYALIIISFYIYHHVLVVKYGDYIKYKIPELDVVNVSKCSTGYNFCEYDRLTGWSIGRILLFATVGVIMPDKYSTIIIFSSIMELMSHSNKGRPRVLTNFGTNIVGYTSGSQIVNIFKHLK